jgi:hypothetical protein
MGHRDGAVLGGTYSWPISWQQSRAWTKEPILRTFQGQLIALTVLRVLQARPDQLRGPGSWWLKPEWNSHKRQASILDLRRLFWRYRQRFRRSWSPWRISKKSRIPFL